MNPGPKKDSIPWNKGKRQKLRDRIGMRFGRLVIIELSEHRDKGRNTYYECLCDCGKQKTVQYAGLTSGDIASCGCLLKDYQLGRTLEAWEAAYRLFKTNTRNRIKQAKDNKLGEKKFELTLTLEEYKEIASSSCFYCGDSPQLWKRKMINVNGIDRSNNNIGYIKDNCVACCKTCNRAKHAMTLSEWEAWISRIIKHNS